MTDLEKIWQKLQEVALRDNIISIEEEDIIESVIKNVEKFDKVLVHALEDGNITIDEKKTLEKATDTTVCGPQCIATLMIIGKEMGYGTAKKLKYYTSYEKQGGKGPSEYSVGYFAGIISK